MSIDGMYRRWLYPNFSTPVLSEPAFTDISEPLALPVFRKKRIWHQFVLPEREAPEAPRWVEQPWQLPQKKPWAYSEFERFEDVQPPREIPEWIEPPWEYPRGKQWVRPGLGPNPNPTTGPDVDIQWQVPFVIPVHPKWQQRVPFPEDPPDENELPNPLPFPEWDLVRKPPVPRLWTIFLGNGAGFGLFTPVEWQWPRKKPWSGNALEPVDDLPLPKVSTPFPEPPWQIPRLRVITQYRHPFETLVIPEEYFEPTGPLCPRPMRRPDTKC